MGVRGEVLPVGRRPVTVPGRRGARLRLDIERGWEDLGWVNVAMFRIQKIDFALSHRGGQPPSRRLRLGQVVLRLTLLRNSA